jgi:hypothetical protein
MICVGLKTKKRKKNDNEVSHFRGCYYCGGVKVTNRGCKSIHISLSRNISRNDGRDKRQKRPNSTACARCCSHDASR